MRLFKFVQIVLLLCAAAALVFGGTATLESAVLVRRALPAVGTVVRIQWQVDTRRLYDASGYRVVVRYRRADGRSGILVDQGGFGTPGYSVGDKVRVLYDPSRPAVARIDSFRSLWLAPLAALVGGLMILGVLAAMRALPGVADAAAGLRRWFRRLRSPLPEPRRARPAFPRFATRIAYCIPAWCWPFLLLYVAEGDWSRGGLDSRLSLAIFFVCNFPAFHAWLRGRLPSLEMLTLGLVAPFVVWAALVLPM